MDTLNGTDAVAMTMLIRIGSKFLYILLIWLQFRCIRSRRAVCTAVTAGVLLSVMVLGNLWTHLPNDIDYIGFGWRLPIMGLIFNTLYFFLAMWKDRKATRNMN